MARNTRPGTRQAALRAAVSAAGGIEAVAADQGLTDSAVSLWSSTEEGRNGPNFSQLDRQSRITPAFALPLARHFAAVSGHFVLPMPDTCGSAPNRAFAELMGEVGDLARHMAESYDPEISDDATRITARDARKCIADLDRLIARQALLRAALAEIAEGRADG